MPGMNVSTGRAIDDVAHLRQSISQILTTPIGSRVMRREFGSLNTELVDQPTNATTVVRLYAAAAGSLIKWEPRIRLSRIQVVSAAEPGQLALDINGTYVQDGLVKGLAMRIPLQNTTV